jgi:hypothetical protein
MSSHRRSTIDWETHDAENAMWELLKAYCIPTTGIHRPLPELQLRRGIVKELVKNGGKLGLQHIADAMWDSELAKERSKKLLGKEATTNE